MEIAEIKDGLFQGSKYSDQDFDQLKKLGIEVVIDLEGGFDPQYPGLISYLYWPIKDVPWLPNEMELIAVSSCGFTFWNGAKKRVLTHCAQGFNRSGLVNGMILHLTGEFSGADAVKLIREKRPGALFNLVFAHYLENLK